MSLVTYGGLPELSEDDRLVAAALPAVWDDERVDWTAFDGVVVRSCWDYHLKPAAFLDWVGGLERQHRR